MILNAISETKLKGVKPDLVKVVRRAAEITTHPFAIVQGVRTAAQQQALYDRGRKPGHPGPIVTWTLKSKHIGGNAIDFAALVNGTINWQEKYYPPIALAFKTAALELGIGIEWGGDWHTKDWGHIQLTGRAVVTVTPVPAAHVIARLVSDALGNSVEPIAKTNPEIAMDFFLQRGWMPYQAAAIVGAGQQESFMRIDPLAAGDDPDGKGPKPPKSFGGWQWNGKRLEGLRMFAEKNGLDYQDFNTQLAFVEYEMMTTEKRTKVLLQAASTVEEAVKAFMGYERPTGFSWEHPENGNGYNNRLKNARALLK